MPLMRGLMMLDTNDMWCRHYRYAEDADIVTEMCCGGYHSVM